jgi:hypothetical protein
MFWNTNDMSPGHNVPGCIIQDLLFLLQYAMQPTYSSTVNHRDTYLEQQETEKIETEVRDVDRRRITKVYACCQGWPSGGS